MVQPDWRYNPLFQINYPLNNPASARDDTPVLLTGVASATQGHAILGRLAIGDQTAIAAAGLQAVLPYDTQVHEWGLGRDPQSGHHFLVRGGPGMVNWGHPDISGLESVAHTHPYQAVDRGAVAAQLGPTLAEALAAWLPCGLPLGYMPGGLWYLFPSNQDVAAAYYTGHQADELVYTPFRLGNDGWLSRAQGDVITVQFGPVRASLLPTAAQYVKSAKTRIDPDDNNSETNGLKALEQKCLQYLYAPMTVRAGAVTIAAGVLQVDPLKGTDGRSPEFAWVRATAPDGLRTRAEVHAAIRGFRG